LKNTWKRNGGIKGKTNWFILLIILYLLSLIRKHQGWRHKGKVEGKHIFITGAGNGIGRCVAIRLAQRGAKISMVDVSE
jgi:5,10-methylene-tetrahydrofolate dehydrogenase/methenyl tetrahydrofolate cyclohydrolase